ncbi:efflux transporter outer membrane subunit [Sphingomonadaceae bacterium jetA1]|jgi:NodT family efflux transporter outer membrane factor (OMF) lipoprotein|uniref:efflux transporter outer membrane subunit n=1 Tax=Facivitalis istanbulensis TaxID=3075838 RepID=UPI00347EAE99
MRPSVSLLVPVMLLTGCASLTRTPYVRPDAPLPTGFAHAAAGASSPVRDDRWWRGFGDPSLDALIDLAIARNPDLAAAAVRVRRANLQARLTGNALLPIASGTLSTGLSRPLSGDRRGAETATGTVGVNWEADLFGKLAADRDAARFEALATAEDRDAAFLSLVGTAASLHWQVALANERIGLGEQSLAYARRVATLVETQYRAGAVSALERREVEQVVTAQDAALSQLRQTRTEARQALMVLLDGAAPPGRERQTLEGVRLPAIAAGLPADLLGRRPDLRAAELRLRRTLASSDATRASYYPALTLTGGLGTSSTALLNLVSNPVATLGAGLTLPFLNVRARRFDTAIARANYDEAVILFRKSLYTALAEVENALSARTELAAQGEALRTARDAAAAAERLYEVRYRAGAVPLRSWLDAQERRRTADLAYSGNRFTLLQNRVVLHQALGGGFAR